MQIITIINIYSPKNYEQTQRERRLKESPKPAVPEAAGRNAGGDLPPDKIGEIERRNRRNRRTKSAMSSNRQRPEGKAGGGARPTGPNGLVFLKKQ